MSKHEVIRKIFVEDDLSNFEDCHDPDWITEINGLVENTSIEKVVGNFATSWLGNARAFVLPWLLVTGVSDIINGFSGVPVTIPSHVVWKEYVKNPGFNVALWKLSENVYCSLYFAYESLIVDLVKMILGAPIRITQKDFNKKLQSVYGENLTFRIWSGPFVYTARETRNSVVHNGSKATDALLKVRPLPHYIRDGNVVISASVARELFSSLKPLVKEIVKVSLKKIEV